MLKNCAYCEKEFEGSDKQMYCSNSHRSAASQGKTFRGLAEATSNPQLATSNPQAPRAEKTTKSSYSNYEQYIISDLESKVKDLKSEVTKLESKNEKLLEENTSLEKQVENSTRKLTEKPGGLAGFMDDPAIKSQLMELGMPVLDKLVTWVTNQAVPNPNQQQLGESPQGEPNFVYAWLVKQSPDIQNQFVLLLEGLEASKRTKDYLESWNRNFMGIIKQARTNR